MRDYGIVSPRFWIGETGKVLRGDAEAQVLALYLMTSPHSSMTGVFHCPLLYMAHETGLELEGASKALRRLIDGGFCEYEESSETVFVIRMAAYQVAESLKEGDKRIVGLRKDVEKMPAGGIRAHFLEVYGERFHIADLAESARGIEGASKPHRSQEQEQDQEQDQERAPPAVAVDSVVGQSGKPEKRKAVEIDTWLSSLDTDADAIPATDPIFEYAEKAGIPVEHLELSWKRFQEDMRAKHKRQLDWRAHYRNAVKGNWYKLWWFDHEGTCQLTTTGEQARRAAA